MSDSEAPDYLYDDFDPNSANVPRLRSILIAHNVNYPSNAKKAGLIELFNDFIVPQRQKILDQRARARRTSRGIVDAASSQESSNQGFSQESVDEKIPDIRPPRQGSLRARSPRKASRIKSEELDYPPPPSPTKRATRSSSRQASTQRDNTYGASDHLRPARRRTPEIKQEEPEEPLLFRRAPDVDSAFTDDNPFQSGSSPAQLPRSTGRRKTTDTNSARGKRRSGSARRSDLPAKLPSIEYDDPDEVPFEPAPVTPEPNASLHHDYDAGEEFTPEEQLELDQELATKGKSVAARNNIKTQVSKGNGLSTPFGVLFFALLSAFLLWYRQEKIAVGYCGLGRPATQIIPPNIELPDWVTILVEPQCETCPPHAYCYEDFVAKCEADYILTPHPLSFGGLVPLPPTCEPDGEKVRRVKAVADKAVEELRELRAKFECGELVDDKGEPVGTPAVDEQDLKETISKKRGKRMSAREFDELWEAAIGEIIAREEVEVAVETPVMPIVVPEISGHIQNTRLSSTSLARLPLLCTAKRSFRQGLARYRFHLGLIGLLAATVLYIRAWYRNRVKTEAQVPALVDTVLERLAAQKELGEEGVDDPWLFLPNLRDDVLRSVHSLAERERIWARVRRVVEMNSNVRTSQREGRSGEVGRAWEWIGAAGGSEINRRRSRMSGIGLGRASLGMVDVKGEEDDETPSKEPVSFRTWEGKKRPIY